jgi:hypothetical protein
MIVAYEFEPDQLALLDDLFKWATRPENVWTPGTEPPGIRHNSKRCLEGLEVSDRGSRPVLLIVIFTMTRQPIGLCRHATIMLYTEQGNEPPPNALIDLVGKRLGFTGDFRTWLVALLPSTEALAIFQPIESTKGESDDRRV